MRRGWLIALLAAAGGALGVAAEIESHSALNEAAADLATGWTLLACGLWGIQQRPSQTRWMLLAASGLTWFAGNFPAGAALVYLHRGPLVHGVIAATRRRSALALATIGVGYADGLVVGRANGWLTASLAGLLGLAATRRGTDRRLVASIASLAGGLALAATAVLAREAASEASALLYGYEAALCASALLLVGAGARELRVRGAVADLVIELGPARRSRGARDALARALGDPTLAIGYWLPEDGRYVDRDGRPFSLPVADSGRATTVVEHDGERLAVLVHDKSLLDDTQLIAAIRDAAALMLANARLQAEAEARLAELRASRRRIVTARDEQRRRLALRLNDGAERRLAEVALAVGRARAEATGAQHELLDVIDGELEQARTELRELASGIHPRILTERGLAPALAALGERASIPVTLTAPDGRLPGPVEAAAYFVCSEAFANAAKHAHACCLRCDVTRNGRELRVTIADDGVGGADTTLGTGLRGLIDRVEALGGGLRISSPPGEGTTIDVALPLREELP